MIDKEFIQELYRQGLTFAYIGEQVGVSKQRIHQIIAHYKNTGRRGRKEKYRNFGKCNRCKLIAEVLHHKDFNNLNDTMENLEPLCKNCHLLQHKGRKHKMSYNNLATRQ